MLTRFIPVATLRVTVAEIKIRLARNIIFTTVVVPLLTVNYSFSRLLGLFHISCQNLLLTDIRILQPALNNTREKMVSHYSLQISVSQCCHFS